MAVKRREERLHSRSANGANYPSPGRRPRYADGFDEGLKVRSMTHSRPNPLLDSTGSHAGFSSFPGGRIPAMSCRSPTTTCPMRILLHVGLGRFAFVFGVAFDGFDEIGDEVVSAFELGVDSGPRFAALVAEAHQAVVSGDEPDQEDSKSISSNPKNSVTRSKKPSGRMKSGWSGRGGRSMTTEKVWLVVCLRPLESLDWVS